MSRTTRVIAAGAGLARASGAAFADNNGAYDARCDRNSEFDFARVAGAIAGGAIGHNVSVD